MLIGYGKTGREIEEAAPSHGHEIVSVIGVSNQDNLESEAFKSADVAIEFTNLMIAYSNYTEAFKADVKLVSGSTGWMVEHDDKVKELCSRGGKTLFWPSNSNLGVAIFSVVNKYLAKTINQLPAYGMTMSETHHMHKLDAPSGTATTLAESILENMERKNVWVKGEAHSTNGLPIHSIREGEVFGIHTIRYDSEADSISVIHDAKNRGGFAPGAVLAVEYIATHEGYLGISNLFPFLKD